MEFTSEQIARAHGVLLGTAVGDALGAGLEFGGVLQYPTTIGMTGGGTFGWRPGEWTDDTSMGIIIARAIAKFGTLEDGPAMDQIAADFHAWAREALDVGVQTGNVLGAARVHGVHAKELTAAAADYTVQYPDKAGNGSLMRTAPVALAYLDDPAMLADRARAVSALTHAHVDATDACALWCLGIRAAVLGGSTNAARDGILAGLEFVDASRRDVWRERIAAAETGEPWDFPKNGWVVHAFQAAWSAITCTRSHDGAPVEPFEHGVDHAVRCGYDTDTVGAIAGGMLGAIHGVKSIPQQWVAILNGWPDMRGDELALLAHHMLAPGGVE